MPLDVSYEDFANKVLEWILVESKELYCITKDLPTEDDFIVVWITVVLIYLIDQEGLA